MVKRHEILGDAEESRHILGLVPVYPSTGDLSVRTIRTAAARGCAGGRPPGRPAAGRDAGRGGATPAGPRPCWPATFPADMEEAGRARERLAFEELLLLQLAVLRRRPGAGRAASGRGRSAAPADLSRPLPRRPALSRPRGAQPRVIGRDRARPARGPCPCAACSTATWVGQDHGGRLLPAAGRGAAAARRRSWRPPRSWPTSTTCGLSAQLRAAGRATCGLLKGSQTGGRAAGGAQAPGARARSTWWWARTPSSRRASRFRDLRVAVVDEQHRFGVRQRDAIGGPADGERSAAHPAHVGHAHPAHAQPDPLRRPGRERPRRDAARAARPVRTRLVFPEQRARMWEFVRGAARSAGGRPTWSAR